MTGKILVTGSTGFIGRVVCRVLAERGSSLRILLRPATTHTRLPLRDVETVVASFEDAPGIRSALTDVDTVIHLASAENARRRRNLLAVDVEGTRMLLTQAKASGVGRFVYLSHLGADRASAFPFLQAKGIAESAIRESGLDFLILRTSMVFGTGDSFTNMIALMARILPAVFFIPDYDSQVQPLWVEDLAACLDYCLSTGAYFGDVLSLGGPEHFTFQQVVEAVLNEIRTPRILVRAWPPLMRLATRMMDATFPSAPITPFWIDYLAVNHTCEANNLPRLFGLKPARLSEQLGYLQRRRGLRTALRYFSRGREVLYEGAGVIPASTRE